MRREQKRDYEFPTVVTSKAGLRRVLDGNEGMIDDATAVLNTFGGLVITFKPPRGRSRVGTVTIRAAHVG